MKSLIIKLKLIIYTIRIQHYNNAMTRLSEILGNFVNEYGDVVDMLSASYGKETVIHEIGRINAALDDEDLILAADLLEGVCIPALESLNRSIEPICAGEYIIESTCSGWLTVKSKVSNGYLHSNIDPIWEADELVRGVYDPSKDEYIIWGLGLGYTALKMFEYTDGSVPIKVYEEDKELITIADEYGVGKELKKNEVEIIWDEYAKGFAETLKRSDNKGILINRACVYKIKNPELRSVLCDFYNEYESVNTYAQRLERNYYRNIKLVKHNIDEISDEIKGSEVIIVAAGPSLDESIDFLRESKGRKVIFCVGTVLKKLINIGIKPDYVFFLDAQSRNMHQIEGVEDCGVKAVFGVTSYWKITAEYRGDKYIAYQSSYNKSHECKGVNLFDTGGTVTSLAIDVALKMSAKSVYLIGVDMAYKDGYSHASGTHDIRRVNCDSLIEVQGNSGQMVYTTQTLNKFRMWIENDISKYPDIPVYNCSLSGAYIRGTRIVNE